jgi:DNA-binding NtrC family response regulator
MKNSKLEVLYIDDDLTWREIIRDDLGRQISLTLTTNLKDAKTYINSDLFDRVIAGNVIYSSPEGNERKAC